MRQVLTAILAASCVLAGAAYAESPTPYPDFTFKRVKPPTPQGSKRITVQITPEDIKNRFKPRPKPEVTEAAAVAAGLPPAEAIGRHSWFWDAVSPTLADAGPGRLEPALMRIARPPAGAGVKAPRLETLLGIAESYGPDILRTTVGTQVSPALVLAVIAVESAGRPDAVSGAGAEGLMQLMPATAERFGVSDRKVPAANIRGGVAFLNLLMQEFKGDPILVLAGYNAGENSITKYAGVPPFPETRDYVPKVLAAFEVARSLCRTRPELISDGCVFSLSS